MFEIKIKETGELVEDKIKTEQEAKDMIARWEEVDKKEEIYTPDYYEISGEEDDDEYVCTNCSGSGEGNYEGSTCWTCNGAGTIYITEDI